MAFWKNNRISPARVILLGFLALILLGTVLLMLPISTRDAGGASFFDALFTAVSATCVTGLVVQDTATYWSVFGQGVILLLIQVGGMGVVTVAVAIGMFSGRRIGLKQRWVMQESISAPQVGGIVRMTSFIFKLTLLMESVGAVALAFRFCPQMGFSGVWAAVFHSVSAFCNAGFDLMGGESGPFSSLTSYVGDPLINGIVICLLVAGGLGFVTWSDIRTHKFRLRAYRLQSKIILTTAAMLLVLPAVYFYFYEFSLPQWSHLTGGERLMASVFQSATPRTAGFNTVDIGGFSEPGKLITIALMLVGGSPGSTAGGFKITTLAMLLLTVRSVFRRNEDIRCFGRRLPSDTLRSATTIFTLYLTLFLVGGVLICCLDSIPLLDALFETASAIGTVGLTTGVTGTLGLPSRMILVFLMYFGRVGGLTLIFALAPSKNTALSQFPQEKMTVG